MAGLDFQGCFLRRLVSSTCRRVLGVRHVVYLFLPFGQGLSPGWDDLCVKEVPRVARPVRPPLQIIAFVGNPRMVGHGAICS